MRTRVIIETDHVTPLPVLRALDVIMETGSASAESRSEWMFATAEQAGAAVDRVKDLQSALATMKISTVADPGCLDGGEA